MQLSCNENHVRVEEEHEYYDSLLLHVYILLGLIDRRYYHLKFNLLKKNKHKDACYKLKVSTVKNRF